MVPRFNNKEMDYSLLSVYENFFEENRAITRKSVNK